MSTGLHRSDFFYTFANQFMKRDPKFKAVVHFVEEQIQSGQLSLGDRIPSVNAFRIRFGLSRSSIFLAMQELQSRGIIEAAPAIGYFVHSTRIEVQRKILLLFNEFNAFKEDLYLSFLEAIGTDVSVDIMYHHYDRNVFETLLREADGRYTSYVLMPGKFRDLAPLLDRLQGQVFLLDHFQDDIRDRYPSVGQDFEQDTYDALLLGLSAIRKYDTLVLVQNDKKEPDERYAGIQRFCAEFGFGSMLRPSIKDDDFIHRGMLFLTPSDRELVNIIKKANARNMEIGSDIGILSFNDTPLKEVLCGGIATLTTDFHEMGRTMASLILGPSQASSTPTIRNPWMLLRRKSL